MAPLLRVGISLLSGRGLGNGSHGEAAGVNCWKIRHVVIYISTTLIGQVLILDIAVCSPCLAIKQAGLQGA